MKSVSTDSHKSYGLWSSILFWDTDYTYTDTECESDTILLVTEKKGTVWSRRDQSV